MAARKKPLAPDDVGRYRDIHRLGVGGMATVTLAEDTLLGRRVALKRVHAGGDDRATSRLRREALVGASLSHPNLVAIYDVEIGEDGDLVIVMEYVAGQTLRDAIAGSGGLPPAFVLNVLDGLAAGLDTIHARGIVHRDVKPANVLLGREGAVKLADLGIALAEDRTRITNAGEILGTFSYMAPEQLEGLPSTPAVDIYALALVAFEMLSGEKARPETNPVALAHAIATRPPPDLRAISSETPPAAADVLKLGMAADPAKRPLTAGDLVDRLRAALEGPVSRPRRPRLPEPGGNTMQVVRDPAPAEHRSAGPRKRSSGAEGLRGRSGIVLAGLLGCGLVAIVVAVLASGGGAPKAPATAHGTGKTSAATSSSGASSPAESQVTGNASTSTPSGAVRTFYARAAAHDYAGAWALADPAFRSELAGYASFAAGQSQVRSITFDEAQTT
ncbi:MAG TPA: serine/threonine-protein kinase, partial [Solirubrobacteraceae bacterium]|nr:serine/threonine-protein kinase [Solirubrobacteraceae bacterium]